MLTHISWYGGMVDVIMICGGVLYVGVVCHVVVLSYVVWYVV